MSPVPLGALAVVTVAGRTHRPTPFDDDNENASYANLAEHCAARGIDLCVTHFDNLESGDEARAWQWRERSWRQTTCRFSRLSLCYADLPLNVPGAVRFERALTSHPVTVVNHLRLSDCLTDKLATYELLADHVPLTRSATEADLMSHLGEAKLHPDLSLRKLFLKPRYGERGRGIHVIEPERLEEHPAFGREDYIVQPLLETEQGLSELGIRSRHDLRLILCDGRIELAFARTPAKGSYVSNFAQGGRELPVATERLPARIRRFAAAVDRRLCHFGPRLYSLDLGVGASGKIWIYELNTMPGIVWDEAIPETRPLHAKMHEIVAVWLRSSLAAT